MIDLLVEESHVGVGEFVLIKRELMVMALVTHVCLSMKISYLKTVDLWFRNW